MGSFGISCGVSKLPIAEGHKAGILIISKQRYSVLDAVSSECNLASNEGAYGGFFAVGLPIFGEYDDYGRLSNYVKDINYHILKSFIEKNSYSFDEFMDKLYEGDAPLLSGLQVGGMFFHGEVYDEVVNTTNGCTKSLDMKPVVLEKLGFHKTDEPTNDKRYKYMYRYNDTDIEIHHDGTWGHFMKDGKQHSMYSPLDLKENMDRLYGIDIDISYFETVSRYDMIFDDVQKEILELHNISDDDPMKDVKIMLSEDSGFKITELSLGNRYGFDQFKEIYHESILDGTIKKALVDWTKFASFIYNTNTLIMPSMMGSQFGNYRASSKLYEISYKISQRMVKEQEEDY